MSKIGAWFHFCNRAITNARPRLRGSFLAALPLVLQSMATSTAAAQSAPRPEQLIKWRQSAYQAIAWNSTRLKTALAGGSYDAAEVRAAANTLAALAASGLPSLFAAGTDKGKGWRETTAASAVFTDNARFRQLSEEFARDAALLAKLAAGTDAKPVQEQFLKVAQACKSCHNHFRQTE